MSSTQTFPHVRAQELLVAFVLLGASWTVLLASPVPNVGSYGGFAYNSSQVRARRSIVWDIPPRRNGGGQSGSSSATEIDDGLDDTTFLQFQPLCRERRVRVELRNLDAGIDYYPEQYEEVYCESTGRSTTPFDRCAHPGFQCVQQYSTLFIIKRDISKDCYLQKETRLVPSGCECMWPVEQLGGVGAHY